MVNMNKMKPWDRDARDEDIMTRRVDGLSCYVGGLKLLDTRLLRSLLVDEHWLASDRLSLTFDASLHLQLSSDPTPQPENI
jgi:hypothetical protein